MTPQEIIDGLAEAICDPECPVQFSPLLMGARLLLLRQATENERLRALERKFMEGDTGARLPEDFGPPNSSQIAPSGGL